MSYIKLYSMRTVPWECAPQKVWLLPCNRRKTVELKGLTGDWKEEEGMVSCQSQDGYSDVLEAVIPEQCCIKAKLTYKGKPTRFGLALQFMKVLTKAITLCLNPVLTG